MTQPLRLDVNSGVIESAAFIGPNVKFRQCTRCVMDTTALEISFDEAGMCSFCSWFDSSVAWRLVSPSRAHELNLMVEQIKTARAAEDYDCVIGLSGGVDSSFLLVWAVEQGLRPLALHVDAGWNSELAVSNIEKLVTTLDVDLETVVIDWKSMVNLQIAFLESGVPNQDIPQDHAFFTSIYRAAEKEKIPYILNGNNFATESILPVSWGHSSNDGDHIKDVAKKNGLSNVGAFPTASVIDYQISWPYLKKIKPFAPLNLMDYSKDIAKNRLHLLGWRDYGAKHTESVWTKYFQRFYLPYRFGYDKRKAHLSSEILAGNLSRAEAMSELETPLYPEADRERDEAFIARKLGISLDKFVSLREANIRPHSEYKTGSRIADFARFGVRSLARGRSIAGKFFR